MMPPAPVAVVAEEPSPAVDLPALVGLVTVPAPGRSVAVLRSGVRTRVVTLGESAFGVRLVRVAGDVATVEVAGREADLRFGSAPAAPPPPAPVAAAATPPAPGSAAPGTPQEWSRDDLQRRLAQEAPRIMAETTLLPVWNAGRVAGFTISRVPDGSILSDAGIEAGDVLTHVNGTPVDSLATLVGLWPRLQAAGTVEADLVRGGQPVHLQINLK